MSKFYEPIDPTGIKNDYDLRIAIHNKTRRTLNLLVTFINESRELYNVVTLAYGEQAFSNYSDRNKLLNFHATMDAFICLITSNLCVLLGDRKNDKLSILKDKESYNVAMIDKFYAKHEKELKSLFIVRDKVYAHIDADVTANAFQHDINFLGKCVGFLTNLLLIERTNNE